MASSYLNRAADVGLEDGQERNVLAGVFNGLSLQSFEESLQPVVSQSDNMSLLMKKARKKARKVKGYASMSEDMKAAIVLYTMEDYPRENSPYYLLNAALREKDRGKVRGECGSIARTFSDGRFPGRSVARIHLAPPPCPSGAASKHYPCCGSWLPESSLRSWRPVRERRGIRLVVVFFHSDDG